jgi:hypothetical protein
MGKNRRFRLSDSLIQGRNSDSSSQHSNLLRTMLNSRLRVVR